MTRTTKLRWALPAVMLALGLAACDGDDGAMGAQGPQGPAGDGAPGAAGAPGAPGAGDTLLDLRRIGSFQDPALDYATEIFDTGAAEIVAFDPVTRRLFVVNAAAVTVDVLDISNPANPQRVQNIDATAEGGGANSVAVFGGVAAVAIEANQKTDPGKVVFYDTDTLDKLGEATVGALPDMLTFTRDGTAVLVANEGESNGYGNPDSVDPVGSVSVIDVRGGFANPAVATAGFEAFNSQADALRAQGVRIYGPGATVAQDLEPEYIAEAVDGPTAWVNLQEANAHAVLDFSDLANPVITAIRPYGYKRHSAIGNELDASDRDPRDFPQINIRNWPVLGMYQPDAIASYRFNGQTFYVTANEGDDRNDFLQVEETLRIKDMTVDATRFPNTAELQADGAIGRLNATTTMGDIDGDGDFDELYVLGGRSFSIWSADGEQVYDSGSDFERITAQRFPNNFNANNDENDPEGRSDNKGPEPEGVAVGTLAGRTFAFIGLERIGGVMVYDVTHPQSAKFVQYVTNRDFSKDPETDPTSGDLGPEGLAFIAAADSPNGMPLLVVGNEVSGTTSIYQIDVIEVTAD